MWQKLHCSFSFAVKCEKAHTLLILDELLMHLYTEGLEHKERGKKGLKWRKKRPTCKRRRKEKGLDVKMSKGLNPNSCSRSPWAWHFPFPLSPAAPPAAAAARLAWRCTTELAAAPSRYPLLLILHTASANSGLHESSPSTPVAPHSPKKSTAKEREHDDHLQHPPLLQVLLPSPLVKSPPNSLSLSLSLLLVACCLCVQELRKNMLLIFGKLVEPCTVLNSLFSFWPMCALNYCSML